MLDVVLTLDRSLNFFVTLEVNKALDGILFGKSRDQSVAMFVDSSDEIVRNPNVQNAVGGARQNINPTS
jgi:hypothetical protein